MNRLRKASTATALLMGLALSGMSPTATRIVSKPEKRSDPDKLKAAQAKRERKAQKRLGK